MKGTWASGAVAAEGTVVIGILSPPRLLLSTVWWTRYFLQLPLWCYQVTKLEQFSTEFDVLYSRENNPWPGECSGSLAAEDSSRGMRGRNEFSECWQGPVETGHVG